MGSALLITVAESKARMAISALLTEVDPGVESAIRASQIRIASEYGSELHKRTDNNDVFFLDFDSFSGIQPGGVFKLQLSNAFVEEASLVLTYGDAWNRTSTPLPEGSYEVDLVRGIVIVAAEVAKDMYVQAKYTSGFETPDQLPEWLKEALLAYVPVVFNFGQPTNRKDEAKDQARLSGDHALACLALYRRNTGFTFRPIKC